MYAIIFMLIFGEVLHIEFCLQLFASDFRSF